jgi:hypothetical protein
MRLRKAEAAIAVFVDQFERSDVSLVRPDLAVADHPVAGELKPRDFKCRDAH